ncbi:MAG TPA: hypothetical protein DDZ78_06140, partial [Porphyromonadaceae bacterium]|nr:hypothetical protein [Porphyromonadaceae bacterium]
MKKYIFLFLILCFSLSFCTSAQNKILKRISTSDELTPYSSGYIDSKGDTIIPIGKYVYCFTENFDKIAIVILRNSKNYVAINRKENVLFEVLSMDNGPDYVQEGLLRIRKNDKTGYANMDGKIVIQPLYDLALPFKNESAIVAIGGRYVQSGEYQNLEGGKWGLID